MGDILIVKASERINKSVRESDTVARMGGDEFTAILPQINSPEDAVRVVKIMIKKLAQPFDLNGTVVTISASIGIVIYPQDANNSKELLQNADKAMYEAKRQGRGRFYLYQQVEE